MYILFKTHELNYLFIIKIYQKIKKKAKKCTITIQFAQFLDGKAGLRIHQTELSARLTITLFYEKFLKVARRQSTLQLTKTCKKLL